MRKFKPAGVSFVVSTLLRHGHSATEPERSAFVFYLLSFVDLEAYPRREALKAAFSSTGRYQDRCSESIALARARLLEEGDYFYAVSRATKRPSRSETAISLNVQRSN